MFISHQVIADAIKNVEMHVVIGAEEYCITGYELLDQAVTPYYEHSLYIVKSLQELKNLQAVKNMNLMILNPEGEDLDPYILALKEPVNYTDVRTDNLDDLKYQLREFFDIYNGKGYLSDSVLEHLFADKGIQDMVNDFSDAFNNPIFVFDAGYRLIAATWEMALANENSRRMVEEMRVTDEDWKIINFDSPSNDEILASREPLLVHHPAYGYDQLVCSIDPSNALGVIVIDEVNRKFRDVDHDLLKMLRDGVCQRMRLDSFIRNNRGYPYEYFVRDLLDQKIEASALYEGRFQYVEKEFSKNMYCMVIEAARSTTVLNMFLLQEKIESLFLNVKTVLYNGEVIVLFSLKEKELFTKEKLEQIRDLCEQTRVYAGLSNNFCSITELFGYYKQALRAIELGVCAEEKPGLYIYSLYSIKHMTGLFAKIEKKEVYCHPGMRMLLEYDQKNNTELAFSLYQWLIYERNSAACAKAMFIHRNTLIYRLQKIEDMISLDYDDPNERRYLIASYEVMQK